MKRTKKIEGKKLKLDRETIRRLGADALAQVASGKANSNTVPVACPTQPDTFLECP